MAATSTRMLVLGVVSLFEPANGYQLGRELASWRVDEWANVKTGSIYSMLSTLAKQGMVTTHTLPEGSRAVRVYTMTDAGRAELHRLIHEGIETVSAMDPTGFRVAMSFTALVERAEFTGWLEERGRLLASGEAGLEAAAMGIFDSGTAPPQVGISLRLEGRLLGAERSWLREVLDVIRAGGLQFAGEPADWKPADDDPGWAMDEERRRYREQLAARAEHEQSVPVEKRS